MTKPLVVLVPNFRVPSLNTWMKMHWAKKQKLMKTLIDLCRISALESGGGWLGEVKVKRHVKIELTHKPGERFYDDDNGRKVVLDALVRAGLLKNDSHLWVETELVQERWLYHQLRVELRDVTSLPECRGCKQPFRQTTPDATLCNGCGQYFSANVPLAYIDQCPFPPVKKRKRKPPAQLGPAAGSL